MTHFLVQGYHGIGDCIYQRPVIKFLIDREAKKGKRVALATPWPEIYWDLDIDFWFQDCPISWMSDRMRSLNIWSSIHRKLKADLNLSYSNANFRRNEGIAESFCKNLSLINYEMDLPLKDEWLEEASEIKDELGSGICLVKTPTVRREWYASSRNPDNKAFKLLIDKARNECGYKIVSIGNIRHNEEESVCQFKADVSFDRGQLDITTIFALMHLCQLTITGVGFPVPASVAMKSPCITLFGGMVPPNKVIQ